MGAEEEGTQRWVKTREDIKVTGTRNDHRKNVVSFACEGTTLLVFAKLCIKYIRLCS